MITAMTELLILSVIVLVVAVVVSTIRDIHDDGYGRRQPPTSHFPDPFDPATRLRH